MELAWAAFVAIDERYTGTMGGPMNVNVSSAGAPGTADSSPQGKPLFSS
jgi:hypothetical protein